MKNSKGRGILSKTILQDPLTERSLTLDEFTKSRKKHKSKSKMVDMTPEEQRIFQKAWKRVRRTVHGALVNQIHCHGPIDTGHLPSAAKRVVGQLKDPFYEVAIAFIEEMRKAQEELKDK